MKHSVVIPVFNSEKIVGHTIDNVVSFFHDKNLDFDVILVNDGSKDQSWEIISKKAKEYPELTAINLLHNYGQHVANLCGFCHATGDYVITMDDDMQNPPEEIEKLITCAASGHDLVIGEYIKKKHSLVRRLGSKIVRFLIRKIFFSPKNIALSNFRIIRRDVIDRVCGHKSGYPYIPGLLLMYSSNVANVQVKHRERQAGKSNYRFRQIFNLVTEILFNYSSYPLRLVAGMGIIVAFFSFFLSLFYIMKAIFVGVGVPGWTTVVVLLSFFNGIALLILSMLGEYVVRSLTQTSQKEVYHIKEIIRG